MIKYIAALCLISTSAVAQTTDTQLTTKLHITDETFEFASIGLGDLMVIKKSGTSTETTEVHILDASTNYSSFRMQTGTALGQTGANAEFEVMPNGDLMAILKSETASGFTEVHVLNATTNYSTFRTQTATALHQTVVSSEFEVMPNGDLMAILKSGTASGKTEVHVLDADSNYSSFRLQVPTALHETDGTFEFEIMSNADLMAIKKSGTASGKTEVHILDAASNYSSFRLQTATALKPTDRTYDFVILTTGKLAAIKKNGEFATEIYALGENFAPSGSTSNDERTSPDLWDSVLIIGGFIGAALSDPWAL